jgi:hypothetical protein
MSLKYARQKGSRFERQLAKMLSKEFGCDTIRTPMSGAFGTQVHLPDFQGDLYCKDKNSILKTFFFEAKHVESATFTNLHQWYDKCTVQNNGNQTVIFIRDNKHDFILVAMNPGDLYGWVENNKLQSKVGYKHVEKTNSNFWREYEKVKFKSKIPVLVLNNITLLRYEDWVYVIKDK